MRGACFPWANKDARRALQVASRRRVLPVGEQGHAYSNSSGEEGRAKLGRDWGPPRARGTGQGDLSRLGTLPMTTRPRKVAEPAPAPSSPRFTEPNRSPCTKMTISCEGIVHDSSNAVRLWIISLRFPLNCDIFGTGEAIYRPASSFLHNLSSILYRHSGWHRKRPRKGTGASSSGLCQVGQAIRPLPHWHRVHCLPTLASYPSGNRRARVGQALDPCRA